jgi:hypothetical protein
MPVLLGWPNILEHPLSPRPTLGFAGFPILVEKLATAALRQAWAGQFGLGDAP